MQSGKQIFGLKKEELIYLSIISSLFFFLNLFRINFYPIYIDEAFTYVNFTTKGFGSSCSYYPEPNNHVLFSLISNVCYYLPFDTLVNLRLFNVFTGLGSSIILYLFLRKEYSHKVALIPHTLFTFSYIITFYSVFARGYNLIIFFTLLSAICIYRLSKDYSKKYVTLFILFSVLGFYTIPIYLYVFASFGILLLFLFYQKKITLKQLLIINSIIITSVLLLYLPIIYYNGIDAIVNNKFTQKIERSVVIEYLSKNWLGLYDKLLGITSGFLFLLFLGVLFFIRLKKRELKLDRQVINAIVIIFLLPLLFIILHSVIPGNRTWCYLIVPFVIGVAIIINEALSILKVNRFIMYFLCVMIIAGQNYIFKKSHPEYAHPYDQNGVNISKKIVARNYKTFLFNNKEVSSEQVFIEFAYLRQNKEIRTKNNYLSKEKLNSFDCIIIKKEDSSILIPNTYKEIYKDNTIRIFGK